MKRMGRRTALFMHGMWRGMQLLCSAARQDIRDGCLGQCFPPRPTVVQFLVNDIRGSRSTGSHAGQPRQDQEITLAELRHIMADPLFGDVRHVDVTGGEPALRTDLPEMGRVLIDSLPGLKSMQVTTGPLHSRTAIERIMALAQVTRAADIRLGVSVSLDGIGDDHDRDRVIEGSFVSADEVTRTLRENGLPVSVNCTLTPLNCHGADDVMLWAEQNGIQEWVFRLRVDVKRFCNECHGQQDVFTPEQRFHLSMFFDKLARHPRVDLIRRMFYRSLVNQIAFGMPRRSACTWQTDGVTLDMRGNIGYCPPQSPVLGSALQRSAWQMFREGIPERRRIVQQH